ncbi:MAG: cyclic nucleotide-binding domain-containing protein [Oscillospiraceae bacterium]|nr:cyclic nucleotide-binding domain-containing protein [Oscillospiraceae bacterium]
MNTQIYNKGDIIFRQGDAGKSMYDIRWGSVGIYLDYGTEKEKKLTELGTDAFFGEMGMIDHAPRSATAVALEKGTQLREITEEKLGELFRENPAKVLMIMQQLSNRLRKLTKDYMEACRAAADIEKIEEKPEETDSETAEEIKTRVGRYADQIDGYAAYL